MSFDFQLQTPQKSRVEPQRPKELKKEVRREPGKKSMTGQSTPPPFSPQEIAVWSLMIRAYEKPIGLTSMVWGPGWFGIRIGYL